MRLSPVLADLGTYPFVRLEEAKRRLAHEGVSFVDFGVGDPREPVEPFIRQALVDGAGGPAGVSARSGAARAARRDRPLVPAGASASSSTPTPR